MSKGIAVIAIIALILGASGFAMGIISLIPAAKEQTTWYKSNGSTYYSNPAFSWQDVPNLVINYSLKAGESVYFSYLGYAAAFPGSDSYIQVNFKFDGVESSITAMCIRTNSTSNYVIGPISLQWFETGLSSGAHNVTVCMTGSDPHNYIGDHTLFVEIFPAH